MKPATYILDPEAEVFRIYRRELVDGTPGNPVWFCDGLKQVCRFDLTGEPGTCYVSSSPDGAFIEVFQRIGGRGVPYTEVEKRSLARLSVAGEQKALVDLNVNANLGIMGIDAQLVHETAEGYPRSREFAQQAFGEGLQGVRWNSLRDLTGSRVNFALFSRVSGEDEDKILNIEETEPIPDWLASDIAAEFGVTVLRSPALYPIRDVSTVIS
ncbi:RES family NAD+ phosphorylase [Streptomyces sp. NBC_00658]|uniref:RES family NAD+ phosphorylase n=1 Tax=Streptomyces sp. NBC_00658 TaxID=2975800 RepID=UPI003250B0EB